MKGKRHPTEEKIRLLREADSGKNISEVCQDRNISEVTFHRWKREFGMMDINEGKRLKELELENSELKKRLAVFAVEGGLCSGRAVCPLSAPRAGDVSLSGTAPNGAPVAVGGADPHAVGGAPALRLPPDRGAAAPGRLEREPQAGAARAAAAPEFIAKELQQWLAEQQIKTIYVTPASPWENGFVESFHSRFRDEGLNRAQLWTLTEARVVIEDFRQDYNTERPHSSLGYDSPRRFAAKWPGP